MNDPVPCGIRDIDLNHSLPSLQIENGEQAVLAIFWRDNIPVGRRLFLRSELPITASALSALAATVCASALAKLDAEAALPLRSGLDASDVSVVVCTRDRPEDLRRCIAAVSACQPGPKEIIVVDNSSASDTLKLDATVGPNLRVVRESREGLSFARNTGIAAANGSIVAFTDDDVLVAPNWVECIAASFVEPKVAAVTGPVLPRTLQTETEFAFEFDLGGLGRSFEPKVYDKTFLDTGLFKAPRVWELGAGANISIRKTVFDDIGSFDERLGAGAAGCSEDSEFLYRLLNANWTCLYRPEVVVRHDHRGDIKALRRQMRAYMRGHVAALFVQFKESDHFGNLARALFGIPVYHLRGVGYRIAHSLGFRWVEPWGSAARSTRGAQLLGSIEGYFYLLAHRGRAKFSASVTERVND